MLSAVELHAGPGGIGIYSHHPPFGRPPTSVSSAHLQQMPIPSTAVVQEQQVSSMSGTEFARPKPKSIGSLNGMTTSASSPTQKYSHHEQNGPVNLAVNHSTSSASRGSPPSKNEHSDQKEIDVVGLGSSNSSTSSIGPSPMSYASSGSRMSSYPSGLGTNAYQALNYSFYGNRYGAPMFSHRSAYSQHHSSRPTYLPPQLDSYPQYLSAASASYTSNTVGGYSTVASPQLSSSRGDLSTLSHKTASERSHSMSSLNNGHHPYAMKENVPKSAGVRLDDARNNNSKFKVPSGKEGSLKHRILTTTTSSSSSSRSHHTDKHETINHPANRSSLGNNSLLNFTRGSLIELSNGSLRRVEDLRTEDFILSAEKSQDLQLADSTVVKIISTNNNNYVMITFSYDNNRSKVDIEAKLEHPFFVYGQGWASCNPDGSMNAFGLKCQRLQVGDVCISLKPREIKLEPPLSPMPQKRSIQQHQREMYQLQVQQAKEHQHQQQQQQQKHEVMPQNLSRRSSAIPTTSSETAMNSQMAQYSPAFYSLQMSLFAASQGRIPASYAPFLNDDSSSGSHVPHDLNTSMNNNNSNDKLPMLMSKSSSQEVDYDDDLQSRKRRWSAPDIEDEQQQQQQQQTRKIMN